MNDIKYVLINVICFLMMSFASLMSMDATKMAQVKQDIAFATSKSNHTSLAAGLILPVLAERVSGDRMVKIATDAIAMHGGLQGLMNMVALEKKHTK